MLFSQDTKADALARCPFFQGLSRGDLLELAKITEDYTFFAGTELHLEPFTEDLVFFQTPSAAATQLARHRVTPSLTFEALSLELGIITVELFQSGTIS